MSEALLGALVGAGAAVVVQLIAAVVSHRLESARLRFERQRFRLEERAAVRAEIRARKQQILVDILTDANKVIGAVEEFSESGRVGNTTPLDQGRLLRSTSEVTLYAPALVEPINALGTHLSGQAFDAHRKRLTEWLAEAHRLRDGMIVTMRVSLFEDRSR